MSNIEEVFNNVTLSMNIDNEYSDDVRKFLINKKKVLKLQERSSVTDSEISRMLDAINYQISEYPDSQIDSNIINQFDNIMKNQVKLSELFLESIKDFNV